MGLFGNRQAAQRRSRVTRLLPAAAVIAAVASMAGNAIVRDFRQERAQAAARLESVAELRATQVQAWLDRHMSFAQFLDDSAPLADLYLRWQDRGDAQAGKELLARAIDSRHGDGADSALIVDATGTVLAREHPSARDAAPQLRQTVREAIAEADSTHSSIYGRAGTEIPQRLDIVIPLLKTGRPARGAMVLRVDPRRSLFPVLSKWPVPSRTAEAVLWDRIGDRLVNISDVHGRPDSLGPISEPVATSSLPIARTARGELTSGVAARALDYRGHDVLWCARPVSGTGWWLAVKVDMDEVDAPAWKRARETALAALLALLGAALAARLWKQHRNQADLRRRRDELESQVAARTSDLLRANATLEDSARLNREITDAIPGLVAYWDREGRCRFANRAYLDSVGLPAERVMGFALARMQGALHGDGMLAGLQKALAGEAQVFEHQDGAASAERFFQVHFQPARAPGGEVQGAYMMAFDISALKHAEAELARSRDEAETANRAKSAFVANMSHEIRTPLNGILGLAYLLARDPRDALQRERLAKIGDAGQHLLQIINDVLDLSKIEAGKLTLEEADFSLDNLLSAACDMVGERAQAKGLELVVDTDHLPRRLRGDPTRLSQMVLNLLSNAVKFTDSGWIRLKGDLLDDRDGRVHVRFDVHDTGPGIAPERHAQLFSAFEQGDNTTTRRFGGTGLGLSLTRNLAVAMGGEVGAISTPGQGSTFWFTAWLSHATRSDGESLLAPMKAMRILLVDDLPEAAAVIASYLAGMGMQVDTQPGGEAAVRRVEAEMSLGRPYDLMLVDSSTRCDDGTPTLARLHALMGDGMPPCVLMCSSPDDLSGDCAPGANVDAVLDKPVTASALHDVVARVLYRQGGARADPAGAGDANERLVRERHGGQCVLLAEDNIINRLIARELLANAGLVVEQAENGAIALELAAQQKWDLILMDMQMPVMDGLAAARAIRERGDTQVPIIAMTANAFAEDRAACLEAGMNDHVGKPVNPAALYAILMRWLPPMVEQQK
jgi:PAS domain S-box-containing protein